ncbi:MAG TPA: hypothetical protein DEB47_17555 [Citreicella sp.]|nr:hypothetical protein [Citreicella sp.]
MSGRLPFGFPADSVSVTGPVAIGAKPASTALASITVASPSVSASRRTVSMLSRSVPVRVIPSGEIRTLM